MCILLRRRHKLIPIIDMTGRPDVLNALSSLGPREPVLRKSLSLPALPVLIRRLPNPRALPLPRTVVPGA